MPIAIVSFTILVGLISGSYPAILLSRFTSVEAIKGEQRFVGGKATGHSLMVLQFTVSVFLMIGTISIVEQVNYLKEKSLGFDDDQIVVLPLTDLDEKERTRFSHIFKNELKDTTGECIGNIDIDRTTMETI